MVQQFFSGIVEWYFTSLIFCDKLGVNSEEMFDGQVISIPQSFDIVQRHCYIAITAVFVVFHLE